ncbi:MAG: T9SS type A sorting domain-containing protein, partial [Ignavibacteriae bacterium]|nr:T9SS type A sorting domain-containing protein [Ignavibacteriota bacterium]
ALYIGTNNFCGSSQSFNSTDGYVIRKSSISGGGTMVVTVFRGLVATSSSAGPYTPQGVDNFDASTAEGYFIGVDNATFGTLMIRRVSTPGGTPTISGNISLTVPTTYYPINVRHKGNTGGSAKYLDALDDRLFAAQMRSGRLWTAHNINVTNAGVASATASRDACRWYEIQNLTTTPTVVQSGTVYTPNTTNTVNDRNYWIPSVNISGQGHVAMVFSTAGTTEYANVGTVGRLSTDALVTMQTPVLITSSTTNYSPSGDPGGTYGRRWGDYSYVSVDPNDDMTMWCVHQFCDVANSYGVRAVKLLAPPPATITSFSPATIPGGYASFDLTVNGTSSSGSGFFDPGAGFANRLTAGITGGVVVTSVTYVNPTQVILNLNTTNIINPTGNITITNPDGQFTTYNNAPLPVNLSSFNYTVIVRNVNLKWITSQETNNAGFEVQRAVFGSEYLVFSKMAFVSGNGNTNSPTTYNFTDMNLNAGKYQYRLKQIDNNGNFEYHTLNGIVEIGIPKKFDLSQNYPNPFNPSTKIDYLLPVNSYVTVKVFDVSGRLVESLVNQNQKAGYYTVSFNASFLSSGMYFYSISAKGENNNNFSSVKKLVVLK